MIELEFDANMGDFVWQDGDDQNFYTISTGGVYSLTVTNECGVLSQSIEVTVLGPPTVDLGPDLLLCPVQLPVFLKVGNIPDIISYLWDDDSTDAEYEVTQDGTYSVTVSNGCFEASDAIDIVVEDASPVVQLPADQMLCPGEAIVLNAFNVPGEYLWDDGSTDEELVVTSPGTYSLTITNDCGSGSDSVVIDYLPALAQPDLGPDLTLCPGEQHILYANAPGTNVTWQDGSNADSLIVSAGGTYSVEISNMCMTVTDTIVITIDNNPPSIDLVASLTLCQGDTITVSSGIGGVNYLWSTGSAASDIDVFSPGSYSLTVSNTCGSDADTIAVLDGGPAPLVDLGADLALCPGDVSIINPVFTDVDTWLWHDGSSGASFSASAPGIVAIEVSNSCGTNHDTILVSSLPDIPLLYLGSDTALCAGDMIIYDINGPDIQSILWQDGSTSNSFNAQAPATVYATISNQCGQASDTVFITELPPVPALNLGADQSLCPGESITINPGVTGVDYLWQDGSTAATFTTTTPGLITLTISNDCGSVSDQLDIIENTQGPQVDLGPDVLACNGDIVTLTANVLGVNYLWQDGSTSANLSTSTSGTFILNVSNACGTDADTVVVDIHGDVPAPDLGADITLCEGQTVQLQAAADPDQNIEWQDGSSAATFTVSTAGL